MDSNDEYSKCLSEIAQIINHAEEIKKCSLSTKQIIHKQAVSFDCLKMLSNHFCVRFVPANHFYKTSAYLYLKNGICDIVISEKN